MTVFRGAETAGPWDDSSADGRIILHVLGGSCRAADQAETFACSVGSRYQAKWAMRRSALRDRQSFPVDLCFSSDMARKPGEHGIFVC